MNTQSLNLNQDTLEKLFQEGKCLTFFYHYSTEQVNYEMKLAHECHLKNLKQAWIVSKVAILTPDVYSSPFQFFSNGVLIHNFDPTRDNALMLQRIEKMLAFYGYGIKEVFGPQNQFEHMTYDKFLKQISDFAVLRYKPQDHLYVVDLPDKKTFVNKCFEKGQILLTSSKEADIDTTIRDHIALFNDGSFYISEKYALLNKIYDSSIPSYFSSTHPHFCFLKRRYLPEDYFVALEEKAKSFNWYLPKPKVSRQMQQAILSEQDIEEASRYMQKLFNGRKCISVTNPLFKRSDYTPQHDNYVLFDDGKLLISKAVGDLLGRYTTESIQHVFTHLQLDVEYVPSYYIEFIYREIAKKQKTARMIYIEIIKQKARHLKKELNITHHEALELSAKIVGFKNFKKALEITEQNARYAVARDQEEKLIALKDGDDYVMRQYKDYMARVSKK